MDAEEARTIGWALWRVRDDRRRSLQVIADLAGLSKSHLSRIERGERSPPLNEIVALAGALQISVSDLTRPAVPSPANGRWGVRVHQQAPVCWEDGPAETRFETKLLSPKDEISDPTVTPGAATGRAPRTAVGPR